MLAERTDQDVMLDFAVKALSEALVRGLLEQEVRRVYGQQFSPEDIERRLLDFVKFLQDCSGRDLFHESFFALVARRPPEDDEAGRPEEHILCRSKVIR